MALRKPCGTIRRPDCRSVYFGLYLGSVLFDAFDATNDFNGFQHCAATHLFAFAAGKNKACAAGDLFSGAEDFNAAVN